MRIAALFFGRLTKSIDHYTNILDTIGREHTLDIFFSSDNAPDTILQACIQTYSPIAYNNDAIEYKGVLEKYIGMIDGVQVENMIRHFINKHRVITLLEQHIEQTNTMYDCVLSIRFDLAFGHPLSFHDIHTDTVYIPDGADWLGGINDQLAYGDVSSMKKYMHLWLNAEELIENGVSPVHPESMTIANIRYMGLHVVRFDLSYDIRR